MDTRKVGVRLERLVEYVHCPLRALYAEWLGGDDPLCVLNPAERATRDAIGIYFSAKASGCSDARAHQRASQALNKQLRASRKILEPMGFRFYDMHLRLMEIAKNVIEVFSDEDATLLGTSRVAVTSGDYQIEGPILGEVFSKSKANSRFGLVVVQPGVCSPFPGAADILQYGFAHAFVRQSWPEETDIPKTVRVLFADLNSGEVAWQKVTEEHEEAFHSIAAVTAKGFLAQISPARAERERCASCPVYTSCSFSDSNPSNEKREAFLDRFRTRLGDL